MKRLVTDKRIVSTRAREFARNAYLRCRPYDDAGKPFWTHPDRVGSIIRKVTKDPEVIAAAYLHDVIEDTDVTYDTLVTEFGHRVADLVWQVSETGGTDRFDNLVDRDAYLIKFADRLDNLSRMETWSPERKQKFLQRSKFWS